MAGVSASLFVESKINQRPVVLFSKSYCPNSKKIKALFQGDYTLTNKELEVVNIEKRQDVNQIEDYFMEACLSEQRELPQLWVGGKYVGNDFKIMNLHNEGQLSALLTNVGLTVPSINLPQVKTDEDQPKEDGANNSTVEQKEEILKEELKILSQEGSI